MLPSRALTVYYGCPEMPRLSHYFLPRAISVAVFSDATSYKAKRRDFLQRLCKEANEVVKVEARPGDELSFTREKAAPLLSV
ncbi:MAG: hypothetical protein DMG49_12105 [Acidobacteria bacterium]|nr:MAG: hypothetical protein DMG49_12105 [Acidobacteriota bacterium]